MAESLAVQLANHKCASVVAPAGCGKTYLISESVSHTKGCQLVLTHSHAGKSAITTRMRDMRIPVDRYRVETLDSLALNYARAFPKLGEVTKESLESFNWPAICRGAAKALGKTPVQNVIQATYTGIFVDEYQDCDKPQHELVVSLAQLLPCRILGDPLQAVFRPLHKGEALSWPDAISAFPQIGTLSTPHRWKKRSRWAAWLKQPDLDGEGAGKPAGPFLRLLPATRSCSANLFQKRATSFPLPC